MAGSDFSLVSLDSNGSVGPGVAADEDQSLGLLSAVVMGDGPAIPVILDGREGGKVFVRQVDPCDGQPTAFPVYPGEEIKLMMPIAALTLNTTLEVGRLDDLITWMRVVLVRRAGSTVFLRTLRHGEADDGRRVHIRPGEHIQMDPGALVVELDTIDSQQAALSNGYVPLTPALFTWLQFPTGLDEAHREYLLAAARRLDAVNQLLVQVDERRTILRDGGLTGPSIRREVLGLISAVELAIVGLGRAVIMVEKAGSVIACWVPVPVEVSSVGPAIKAFRDAYEHIEERAVGKIWGKPDDAAVSIFDIRRLLSEETLTYADHELDLNMQVPAVIAAVREFLKSAACPKPTRVGSTGQ